MFNPNLINMKVHSATCSCSVELYKQSFTLADFLPNWDISRGFLSVYLIYITGRVSAAVMAGDIIFFCLDGPVVDYTACPYSDFSRGLFYTAYYSPEGRAKLKWAERGWKRGWGHYIF